MPATNEEICAAAVARETPSAWQDGSLVTDDDRENIRALCRFMDRQRAWKEMRRGEAQRKAMALLKSLLTPEQRRQLGRYKSFTATSPSGSAYRFSPGTGYVERVTRHGSRWFRHTGYCVHDDREDPDAMPPADLTVAHLLMVMADEPGFLATANARDLRDQMWNSEYLTRMRRRHEARDA